MRSDNAIEGSDATVYPELSRANLLRMRGDYRGAEEQCLAILKRYPNNATAHTLLGDTYAEQDDLEQAAQWYELAIDLNPESTVDEQKLANVRERMRHKETAASAEQLGLPTGKSNVPVMAVAALAVIIIVTIAAYMVGERAQASASHSSVFSQPIDAPSATTTTPDAPASTATVNAATNPRIPQVDREMVAVIAQRSPVAGNLITLLTDPRNHIVTVTYSVAQNEDQKRIGAELARTVLEQNQDALIVTVRAVREDQIVYMADAPRSRFQDIDPNASGDGWVSHLMTNEWPAHTAQPGVTSEASSSTPPVSSSGTGSVGTESATGATSQFSPPLMGGR